MSAPFRPYESDQILLRGLEKAKAEWSLWCTGHHLLKLYRATQGA
jgi:hypothetical protein